MRNKRTEFRVGRRKQPERNVACMLAASCVEEGNTELGETTGYQRSLLMLRLEGDRTTV